MHRESTDGRAAAVEGSDDRGVEASSSDKPLEAWVEDILANVPEGFAAVDNDWRFTWINPAAARMGGGKASDAIGRTALDALDINPHNPFHVRYLDSKKRGEPIAFTAYSDLFGKWLEVRGYPHAGGYAMLFREVLREPPASVADAGGRRRPDTIRSINQRIFETSMDLLLVSDSQGNLIRVSPSAMAILGYRPDEMVGRNGIEFVLHEDLESTRSEMRSARRGGVMRNFDSRYVHKDGRTVPLAWTGVWSVPDQQHFFIGRDMTERIAAEDRLRRAQRLEAIGQLTGGIAHDFNNLLAIVMGNIELMFDRPGLDARTAACARAALHAAQRGADLTRGLLAFARQQPLAPKVVDANALIADVTGLLQRTLGQHIEVKFIGATGLWPLLIDPASLESTITNLAVNARDAMPQGGHLTIETRNVTLDEDYARSNIGSAPGDYVAVMVSDTGTGMPPDVLNRIYEPFFTTKELGKGTGLGLSMVFGFVKQSGGHIKAYSEPGHGSTIRLYLPRTTVEGSAEQVVAPAEQPARSDREECILMVEDNDALRQVALMQLCRLGYKVLEAQSAAAALDILGTREPVDLLFTDVIMPGGRDGHTLAREALALRPDLKVLYTSGFPRAHLASAGSVATGHAVLAKPYRLQDLARKVREILDG